MPASTASDAILTDALRAALRDAQAQVNTLVLGKPQQVRLAFVALLADGHLLIEDLPGLGKTTLAHAMAATLGLGFARVQFTSDLLPADILGVSVYEAQARRFEFHPGPVFTHVLLADEINRAPPRTQSALLEAMAEHQVSIDGQTRALPDPFLVIATQNPVDQEGTYPLPEAQMDRFMFKEILTYPNPREEAEMVFRIDAGVYTNHRTAPVASLDDILYIRDVARRVYLDPAIVNYITQIVAVTRAPQQYLPPNLARLIEYGASPRATIAFCKAARALALLSGRNHVLPDDVKALAHRVLRHRLILGFEAVAQNVTPEVLIDNVIQAVRTP